ncbi:hypothetical protein LCGC14_2663790 [marine sediment metagenome]|uniref:Uncharacterized protein n=1 Tax=marine sediment metagenome TaxID=412755 RepID=A0A0F8ZR36_9ZZZZ
MQPGPPIKGWRDILLVPMIIRAPSDGVTISLLAELTDQDVLTVVMSINLAMFIGADQGFTFGLFAGAAAGIGWVAMIGVMYLYEGCVMKV